MVDVFSWHEKEKPVQGYNFTGVSAMNNSLPTSAATPTLLADLLAKGWSGPVTLAEHLGTTTLDSFDGFGSETEALFFGVAVHDLGWLRQICVKGSDRERWLNGMVTNAILTLKENEGAYNFLLNAQGRILGDLDVWKLQTGPERIDLTLTIAANQLEATVAHLEHFIIMDDVELHNVCGVSPLGLTGPKAPELLASLGMPVPAAMTVAEGSFDKLQVTVHQTHSTTVPHFELWFAEEELGEAWAKLQAAGAVPVGLQALNALRILEGIPTYGTDILTTDLPQETNQLHALNFTKGCYLGQEIVERIHSRGAVHRHIRQFELTGEIPKLPSALFQDGKSVGELTSADRVPIKGIQHIFALGHLRDEALLGAKPMEYDEGTAVVVNTLPFANNDPQ